MEALKIIKRIASYGVFVAAATLFLLNMVTVSLAPYIDSAKAYERAFMPFLYATFSLGILLLFQLLVIGKPREVEESIYPWLLVVLFGVSLFASAFVLGKAILACSKDQTKNLAYALAGMTPPIVLSFTEIVIGLVFMKNSRKRTESTQQIKENSVTLTKEE